MLLVRGGTWGRRRRPPSSLDEHAIVEAQEGRCVAVLLLSFVVCMLHVALFSALMIGPTFRPSHLSTSDPTLGPTTFSNHSSVFNIICEL